MKQAAAAVPQLTHTALYVCLYIAKAVSLNKLNRQKCVVFENNSDSFSLES